MLNPAASESRGLLMSLPLLSCQRPWWPIASTREQDHDPARRDVRIRRIYGMLSTSWTIATADFPRLVKQATHNFSSPRAFVLPAATMCQAPEGHSRIRWVPSLSICWAPFIKTNKLLSSPGHDVSYVGGKASTRHAGIWRWRRSGW